MPAPPRKRDPEGEAKSSETFLGTINLGTASKSPTKTHRGFGIETEIIFPSPLYMTRNRSIVFSGTDVHSGSSAQHVRESTNDSTQSNRRGRAAMVARNALFSRLVLLVAGAYVKPKSGDQHLHRAFELLKSDAVRADSGRRGDPTVLADSRYLSRICRLKTINEIWLGRKLLNILVGVAGLPATCSINSIK